MTSFSKLLSIILLTFFSISYSQNNLTYYHLTHNNILFPLNYRGILADVKINSLTSIRYKSKGIVYSAGFMLSGKNGNDLWINAMASSARIEDYLPGTYSNNEEDSLAYLYIIKKTDKHFGTSWQNWENAVKLGADFYDGDNDGIYNPIDKNGNGIWDWDEDRPDLLGDETIWCVYKDSKPSEERNFSNITPQGIEIQQTVFVSNSSEELKNAIFVRYKIYNTGIVSEKFDSVYFSVWIDPDLGEFRDDLVGCDTLLNTGFCYQNQPDQEFSERTPAILFDIINGPISYIPGVTFEDVNNNNIYDSDDIPLDSVYNIKGSVLGTEKVLGAKKMDISSFMQIVNYHPTDLPEDGFVLRFYMSGKLPYGGIPNPCEWEFGKILNESCANIDGRFMYSGDPIYLNGWLNNYPWDQRVMVNTGPFQLIKNKPIEIVVAYIVGEGSAPLESLKFAKINSRKIQFLFDNNLFEKDMEPVVEPPEPKLNYDFVLYQNYPNPFNLTTNIRYTLKNTGFTTLKVYDVLGKEISVLVNKEQSEGIYNIEFDASTLPSGIYFYKLTQGVFTESKKMVILR